MPPQNNLATLIPSAPNLSPRARASFKQVCPAFAILRASPP